LAEKNECNEAEPFLRQATKEWPDNAETWRYLGSCLIRLGKYDDLINTFNPMLQKRGLPAEVANVIRSEVDKAREGNLRRLREQLGRDQAAQDRRAMSEAARLAELRAQKSESKSQLDAAERIEREARRIEAEEQRDEGEREARRFNRAQEFTAERIRNVIAAFERRGGFRSPLNDKARTDFIIAESRRTGVPVWLILVQARRETGFGDPKNFTVRDGRRFTDGSTGNAHNLFNIRPGSSWTGKVIWVGPRNRDFRVYKSYEESITDYVNKMSGPLYKGLTLERIAYRYFPPNDNGGRAATEKYIQELIQYAADLGVTVTSNTVPVP
jgi:flagellum-specific peptidoglycan hydrolase FlgJ